MSEIGHFLGALSAGIILGMIFFAGLWWTVNRGLTASIPAAWFGLSTLVRMALIVVGLYVTARSGLMCLIACLCGVFLARAVVMRFARVAG